MQNLFPGVHRSIRKVISTNRWNQKKLIFRCIIWRKFSLFDFMTQSTAVHHFTKSNSMVEGNLIADRSTMRSIFHVTWLVNWFPFARKVHCQDWKCDSALTCWVLSFRKVYTSILPTCIHKLVSPRQYSIKIFSCSLEAQNASLIRVARPYWIVNTKPKGEDSHQWPLSPSRVKKARPQKFKRCAEISSPWCKKDLYAAMGACFHWLEPPRLADRADQGIPNAHDHQIAWNSLSTE